MKDAWDKGMFPPGKTTWDGAGDNKAYLAGQAAFIANTGSVGDRGQDGRSGTLRGDGLFAACRPARRASISPIGPNLRAISAKSEQEPGRGQGADRVPRQPEFMKPYFDVAIYAPVLKDQAEFEAFDGDESDPGRPARISSRTGTAPAYPGCLQHGLCRCSAPTSSCRRWSSASSSTARISTRRWTKRRPQAQAIYDKYK